MNNVTYVILYLLSFGAAYLLVGWLWYSNFAFGKTWRRLTGVNMDGKKPTGKDMVLTMGPSFLFAIVTAYVLNYVLTLFALFYGVEWLVVLTVVSSIWLAFMALPALTNQLYNPKPWKLFGIDVGFNLVWMLVFGVVWILWLTL